jgi:GT2 family glycosyltransferase
MDISVVIPTRNRARHLSRTLQALAGQTFPRERFEVLLVDNGSTDATRDVASRFQTAFAHYKLLSEMQPGAARARNFGIRQSAGDLVLFLDDDVIPAPRLLQEHWLAHQRHPESAILGRVTFPWNGTESPFRWVLIHRPEYLQSFRFADSEDVPFNHFYSCNVSLPRRAFSIVGLFDEEFRAYGFEDTDFGYRLVQSGIRIVFNPQAEGIHDFQRSFVQFADNRFQAGQSFRRLLQKYPELKTWSARQGNPFRRALARALGFLATPLVPLFDSLRLAPLRPLLPVLGRACACHLQYRFWQGFASAHAKSAPE